MLTTDMLIRDMKNYPLRAPQHVKTPVPDKLVRKGSESTNDRDSTNVRRRGMIMIDGRKCKRACGLGSGQTSDKPARASRQYQTDEMFVCHVEQAAERDSLATSEEFVSAVQARTPIWQSKHVHHMNRNVLNKLWKEIAELFPDMEEKALRKKWKNIRDQFMKEFKKIPVSRSGDAGTDENTSMWPYFQMMLVIKDDVTPESNEGNLDEPTDGNSNDNERSPTPQSIAGSSTSTQYTSTKRKQAQDLRQEFMELEKKKLDLLQIKLSQSTERQEPDCEDLSHSCKRLAADDASVNTNSPRLSAPAPATAPAAAPARSTANNNKLCYNLSINISRQHVNAWWSRAQKAKAPAVTPGLKRVFIRTGGGRKSAGITNLLCSST
ncbi:hypothetical protein EVAR_86230_1 [Eumeta japonica]|uniref:MADF domain-containing protein n=1 Tax=Eumeta variegata TaxID=151549 RepID=A0A4C1UBK4_EUMVA|nr:hypothetical protein EVAR_86230_1 [Eumeta japonica]